MEAEDEDGTINDESAHTEDTNDRSDKDGSSDDDGEDLADDESDDDMNSYELAVRNPDWPEDMI